ncbi:sugar phosphate isomerase/epimerase [Phenylobacterium sp.]|uniref:sugar phosphate isomerase/epimerase family protein n=1 Tax=Phenylobacterium sp. TaxID=1871053 RepID=UPI0027304A50|nr:sugar phosphate isomerase/epimerase family protein [Phenylobacterium sp.]MDP1617888.1 sugar phosphate isomerase/epimerase family protein [Phenylobacterium sp.]MDP1989001.1 sugar phosphate isomerase/epimerase family protein [Phenylobacterium sp.]
MKLAVSNIAWPAADRDAAYRLLARHGIRGLEIAPKLLFAQSQDAFAPSPDEAARALDAVRSEGLQLVSMQSLLFGVERAALFRDQASRDRLVAATLRAIDLAGRFDIPNLVFGSPKQRDIPPDLDRAAAETIALDVFHRLGEAAAKANTRLGLEPNPAAYGANFLNRFDETEAFVRRLDHPAVRLILDGGALIMNDEMAVLQDLTPDRVSRISHVHISEPQLAPAPADPQTASQILRAMSAAGYGGWFSIEMKASAGGLEDLDQALGRLGAAVELARSKGLDVR